MTTTATKWTVKGDEDEYVRLGFRDLLFVCLCQHRMVSAVQRVVPMANAEDDQLVVDIDCRLRVDGWTWTST